MHPRGRLSIGVSIGISVLCGAWTADATELRTTRSSTLLEEQCVAAVIVLGFSYLFMV